MTQCIKNYNLASRCTITCAPLIFLASIAWLVSSCIFVPENFTFIIASTVLSSVSLILFVGLIIVRYRSKQQIQEKSENTATSGRQIQLSEEQRHTLQHAQRTECMRQTNEQILGKPENTTTVGRQIQLSEEQRLALELDQRTECVRQTMDRWSDKNISLVPVSTFHCKEVQLSDRFERLSTLHEQAISKVESALRKYDNNSGQIEEVRDAIFECIEITYLYVREMFLDPRFSSKKGIDKADIKKAMFNVIEESTSFLEKTYLLAKETIRFVRAKENSSPGMIDPQYIFWFYQPGTKEFHARMLMNAFSLEVRIHFGDLLHDHDSQIADDGTSLRSSKRAFFDLPSN